MFDSIKKTCRAIRRDYFDPSGATAFMGGIFTAVGLIVTTVALFAPAGPPALLCLLATAVIGGGLIGGGTIAGRVEAGKNEDSWVQDHTHIVGPGLKVTTLANTQRIVTRLTRGLSRSPTLPLDVEKKLAPWLRDAEEAAKEVQGWDRSGQPVAKIQYVREIFNAQGQKVKTPVAAFGLYDPNAAVQPAAAAAPAAPAVAAQPAPVGIVVPKTITLKNQATP